MATQIQVIFHSHSVALQHQLRCAQLKNEGELVSFHRAFVLVALPMPPSSPQQ